MRQTSLDAYNEIKENGLLSEVKWKVYDYLFKKGPSTVKEVILGVAGEFVPGGTFSSRFSELERLGCIAEVNKKICQFSGHQVTIYDVTSNIPKKLKKKKTNDQIIRELRAALTFVWDHEDCTGKMKNGITGFFK